MGTIQLAPGAGTSLAKNPRHLGKSIILMLYPPEYLTAINQEPLPEGHAGGVVSLRKFTVCSLMLALGRKWP